MSKDGRDGEVGLREEDGGGKGRKKGGWVGKRCEEGRMGGKQMERRGKLVFPILSR